MNDKPRIEPPAAPLTLRGGGQDFDRLMGAAISSIRDYAIFALDLHGNILTWNPGAQRIKGYLPGEIIGKHFSVFYPPEDMAWNKPAWELEEALKLGRFEDEGWRLKKDGSRFWANVVITPVRDAGGELIGFAKVTRDLSERRRVEEELRESEERFRLMVQSVKDYGIFMLDPTGVVVSWNEGAERINGYTAPEIVGRHFSTFYPPEDLAWDKPGWELKEAVNAGRFEDEGWRLRKDGGRFWANVIITPLYGDDGTLVGFGKVTRDLSERRRTEEVLRESEERFRLLVHSVKDYGIFLLDPTGVVASWNEGAERMEGYSTEEIVGRHFSVFYPPEDLAWNKPAFELKQAVKLGRFEDEGWRVRQDGTRFWANVVITPLYSSGGNLVGFAKVTRDLTERRAAQEQALETARRIAAEEMARQMAEERNEELTTLIEHMHAQAIELEHQREEAEAANRAKMEFLASMSHELRTPLNAIGGYAELLEMGVRGPVTDDQRQDLERIRRSQQHLLGIINDLLNFTRLEAGKVSFEPGPVPLLEVRDTVAPMIAPQAEAQGISFVTEECPPDVVAIADRAKLEQILINLLSNAVKFTDPGGTVALGCAPEGDRVRMWVRDTGIGISPDKLDSVFEPFVQVGRRLDHPVEGTGLGLSISRELARGMGGDLSATSVEGQGSTFTLTLPRAAE